MKSYSQFYSFLYTQNKLSSNNGILFNGVFKPKLLNNPFGSCSFTNRDFVIPHTAHFDFMINLSFFLF